MNSRRLGGAKGYNWTFLLTHVRVGKADLPLHSGKAPRWLFVRMKRLAKVIVRRAVEEHGKRGFLERVSDPIWFQSLGSLLGYDWHSSGVTTVLTAVLREVTGEVGVYVVGGKGKASRSVPQQLAELEVPKVEELVKASRLAAKVDNSALQDGYQLYHHAMFVTEDGDWAIVQQGMNVQVKSARRYHWLSFAFESFVVEPHTGIISGKTGKVLNLVARESEGVRRASVDLVKEGVPRLQRMYRELKMPWRIDWEAVKRAYELDPENYEELLMVRGIGGKALRALALIAEVVYGERASVKDPAKYSFAFGGKDGVPYPVDLKLMDEVTSYLEGVDLERFLIPAGRRSGRSPTR